jgi:hypothetical protein
VSPGARPPLPILGSVVAAFVLIALAVALPGADVNAFLLRLVELVLAGGAAYLLDDGAAQMTGVTPRTLWRRRLPALASGVAVLGASWACILLLLRSQQSSISLLSVTGETVVIGALAVALASVLVWRGEPQPGSQVAPMVGISGITALIAEHLIGATIFLPVDGSRNDVVVFAWIGAGMLALVVTVLAGRDPASRWGRRPTGHAHALGRRARP